MPQNSGEDRSNQDKELDEIVNKNLSMLKTASGDGIMHMSSTNFYLKENLIAWRDKAIRQAEIRAKIETLKVTHGHQQTGTVLNDEYFVHNVTMLEQQLYLNEEETGE